MEQNTDNSPATLSDCLAAHRSMMRANAARLAVVDELEGHAKEWERLAEEQDEIPGDPAMHRANTYRRTAQAFRLEISTGVPHCSCCPKPTSTRKHN
jgi:hypothetical protein